MKLRGNLVLLLWSWLALAAASSAAPPSSGRYALILTDPPATASVGPSASAEARDARLRLQTTQLMLRRDLERRGFAVTGSVQVLMNAVFVKASREQEAELRSLPGVRSVVPVRLLRRHLDQAVNLVNAPAAWSALGGLTNAGAGVKIAILDTGIDHRHPAFVDPGLSVPAGFPHCQGIDCDFTSNKVIVARSYVALLAAGTGSNPAANSRPDDLSPRDRLGHGTALAMVSAGNTNTGPLGTITGIAPKAWLGNYKVFGSPGVNDSTSGDIIAQALEDALADRMDIAVLSLGSPPLSGPLDTGSICGNTGSDPCDFEATVVESAVQRGLTVVISAGNEGDTGSTIPTPNTVASPATAPSAIAVGASSNSHTFFSTLRASGPNVPANLQSVEALFGDGAVPAAPLTAPVRDVATLDGTGRACTALSAGSLSGVIALVVRSSGVCSFGTKVLNALNAGAVGVVVQQEAGVSGIFPPGGLSGAPIPAVMISTADGDALKSYVAANPAAQVTLDPAYTPFAAPVYNEIAGFSSRGPSVDYLLKPEMVAVGTELYMATQRFDPNGEMYDASGYVVAQGTSFSAPMVAGAAALVKQKNPGFTPAQIKSALITTASTDVTDSGAPASISAAGNGKLNAGAAVAAALTVSPATLSFGAANRQNPSVSVTRPLTLRYTGSADFALSVAPSGSAAIVPALDRSALSFSAGQPEQTVNVSLSGGLPSAGIYEGAVVIEGGGATLRVPYQFLVGDGVAANIIPLLGDGFDGVVGQIVPDGAIAFKVVDRYGVAVTGLSVLWGVTRGTGQILGADSRTDVYGMAFALPALGFFPGTQQFAAQAGNLTIGFTGNARIPPTVASGGVVNAAGFQAGPGIAPGSYISLFGNGLSDFTAIENTLSLPLSLAGVSVSFDVPSANLSLPGRLVFVSPRQINVQVPWELRGQTSVLIKVNLGFISGSLITVQVAEVAPAVYADSQGFAAALDGNFAVITTANPAKRGGVAQLFLNGLGAVDNQPATGEPAGAQPLSRTLAAPTVTIGGAAATVLFSGLAPGFPGLNQVNVLVPSDIPAGTQSLVVSAGGILSPAVSLPVQ